MNYRQIENPEFVLSTAAVFGAPSAIQFMEGTSDTPANPLVTTTPAFYLGRAADGTFTSFQIWSTALQVWVTVIGA